MPKQDEAADVVEPPSRVQRVKNFYNKNLVVVALAFGIVFGLVWPTPGVNIGTEVGPNEINVAQYICIILIFLINGLQLKTSELVKVKDNVPGFIYGFVAILCLTSIIGISLTGLLEKDAFSVPEFRTGLQVFFATPTTVNSGIVLTGQANGNVTLALILTVITNVIGIFTVPPIMGWLIDFNNLESADGGSAGDIQLDVAALVLKLVYTCFLPIMVGKALSTFELVQWFCKAYKYQLKWVSVHCLAMIPFMKISRAKRDGSFDDITAKSLFLIIAWGALVHVVFLIMNVFATVVMQFDLDIKKSIVIQCSQKTLPVALTIVSFLPESAGAEGLMVIPCIVAHLTQLLIDSYIVSKWADVSQEKMEKGAVVEGKGPIVELTTSAENTSTTVQVVV